MAAGFVRSLIMKQRFNLITTALFTASLLGCSAGNESPFTEGGGAGTSSSNIITINKFSIASDNLNPEFVKASYDTTVSPNTIASIISTTEGGTLTITAYGADKDGLKTAGNPITFRSNYGGIEPSCTLTDGTCSVTFTTLGALPDRSLDTINNVESIFANFVIYTLGEESFIDTNGNGYFDDGDGTTFVDIDEPYLDNDNNNTFDQGVDTPIDIDGSGGYTKKDGLYSGSNCQHSTLCSPSPTIVIWKDMQIDLISAEATGP